MRDLPNQQFTLALEPVNGCNLSCRYCYTNNKPSRIMDRYTLTVALRKGIEYALAEGFEEIHVLWHGGEPLLAGANFFQFALDQIEQAGGGMFFRHFIQSNGMLVDDEICQLFREYNFEVGISLDGPADIHDRMRGPRTHKKVLECLDCLRRNGINPGICAVASRLGLGNEKRIYNFFRDLGYGFGINPIIPPLNRKAQKFLFKPGEYGHFLCKLFNIWTTTETNRVRISPLDIFIQSLLTGQTVLCQQEPTCVGQSLFIKSDGRVQLCNRSQQQPMLGNIAEKSIHDIYQQSFCGNLQQRESQLPACQKCHHRSICHGGCPQLAIELYGTMYAPDPFCQDYRMVWDHMSRNGLNGPWRKVVQ